MNIRKNSFNPRHVLRPLLVGFALLMLLSFAATPASAATVYNSRISGSAVYASSQTSDGCSYTYESVSVYQTKPAAPTLFYYASGYNCATGESYYYCAEGSPTTYSIGGNLSTARVIATVSLTDCQGTSTGLTENIDVTWTATSPVFKGAYSSRSTVPGYYVDTYRSSGQFRYASVSGSITGDGYISTSTSGSHTVSIR
jgi:hypothetical protein